MLLLYRFKTPHITVAEQNLYLFVYLWAKFLLFIVFNIYLFISSTARDPCAITRQVDKDAQNRACINTA